MTYCKLKRKTPLKAKTPLRAKTGLRSYAPLRAKTSLKVSGISKNKSPSKKVSVYKPKYPYWSIFTNDLSTCIITGHKKPYFDVHVHHIFGAYNKANSEKYGFMIPLTADWHDMKDYGIHFNRELDLKYKRKCQEYWLKHYGTKDEFIRIFTMWW